MRFLLDLVLNPIVFGSVGVVLLVLTHAIYPQYAGFAGVVFLAWAFAVGLNYAFGGSESGSTSA